MEGEEQEKNSKEADLLKEDLLVLLGEALGGGGGAEAGRRPLLHLLLQPLVPRHRPDVGGGRPAAHGPRPRSAHGRLDRGNI